jgi:hypothetical protein
MHNTLAHVVRGLHLHSKIMPRAVGWGVQPVRLHRAPSRGGAKTGGVKKI